MKKNLRSKILLCVLAGGVLAANTALAAEYTETISGTDDTSYSAIKEQNGNDYTYNFNDGDSLNLNNVQNGVVITPNSNVDSITINGKLDINLTGDKANTHTSVSGICADYNTDGKFIDYRDGGNITLNVESDTAYFAGGVLLAGTNDEIKIGDSNISVSLFSNDTYGITAVGIQALYEGTKVETDNININVSTNATNIKDYYNEAVGIYIQDGATYTANGDTNIKAVSNGYGELTAYGVLTFGSSEINLGNVDIYAEAVKNEKNDSYAYGIYAYNDSVVNMDGGKISVRTNETNDEAYSIYTRDDGEVYINKNGNNNVVINGNVNNDGGLVYLNLDTDKSVLNGAVQTSSGEITLNLKNNATWNVGSNYNSSITNLDMNGGIINQNTSKYIDIENYSGSGDINFTAENTDNDGVLDFANTGDVTIESAEAGSSVNLGVINNTINTLDSEKAEENLNAIAQKLTYKGNNLSGKVTVKEGLITPEVSGDLLFDSNRNRGYVANVKQNSSTTTIDNIKNIAATAIVAWRQEDSTLSQRLGELRESDGGQGIWVRMSRGEFEYDGEYKNQYNFFQMGYDWAAGSWHYGAAVSHNDGQTTYTHGDGENRSTSLSLYGTWLGDKGHYADIVLKQGRLSNNFDIYTEAGHTSGDYDAWGTSLSGEYGMKVDLDGGWYVTPQAQLTLMRIGGEDYTTNNGIKVNQDSLESAVGRVGFEVGKRISDSGSIYAKASLLHDFAGSADTYLSHKGLTNSYHQDIGDTWCEAGIGFNYKTSENSYVYADVVKTFGGDVETPWQWNAGMRWTF